MASTILEILCALCFGKLLKFDKPDFDNNLFNFVKEFNNLGKKAFQDTFLNCLVTKWKKGNNSASLQPRSHKV